MRGRAVWLARKAHNLEVVGSNPTPAKRFSSLVPVDQRVLLDQQVLINLVAFG